MNPPTESAPKSAAKSIWIAILAIIVIGLGFAAFSLYQKNANLITENNQLRAAADATATPQAAADLGDDDFQLTSPAYNTRQFAISKDDAYWVSMDHLSKYPADFKVLKGSLTPSIYSSEERKYVIYAYGTDGRQVFYKGTDVDYADPATFQPIENGEYIHYYGKDDKSAYYTVFRLQDSDPKTFKILWTVPPEGCSMAQYSVDAKHVYFESTPIAGADPKTFEVLSDEYGKDKNHVYHKEKMQEGVSPVNFQAPQTCEYGAANRDLKVAVL